MLSSEYYYAWFDILSYSWYYFYMNSKQDEDTLIVEKLLNHEKILFIKIKCSNYNQKSREKFHIFISAIRYIKRPCLLQLQFFGTSVISKICIEKYKT